MDFLVQGAGDHAFGNMIARLQWTIGVKLCGVIPSRRRNLFGAQTDVSLFMAEVRLLNPGKKCAALFCSNV